MSNLIPAGVELFEKQVSRALASVSLKASQTLSPRPGRTVLIAPGATVAHDDCCRGQVWARLVTIQPMPSNDPRSRPGMDVCAIPELVATMELGIIRCAATVNDHGQAPSELQITADGEQSIKDMAALLGVLRCEPGLRSLIGWTPTGPEGGCHGGFWTFTKLIPNCLTCVEAEEEDQGGEG